MVARAGGAVGYHPAWQARSAEGWGYRAPWKRSAFTLAATWGQRPHVLASPVRAGLGLSVLRLHARACAGLAGIERASYPAKNLPMQILGRADGRDRAVFPVTAVLCFR